MASYTVTDSSGNVRADVGPDTLLALLQELQQLQRSTESSISTSTESSTNSSTDTSTEFVVLRRDDWPDRSALARPQGTGWQIELAEADRTLVAEVPVTDAALDTLRSWAEDDDWWQEAFSWRQV